MQNFEGKIGMNGSTSDIRKQHPWWEVERILQVFTIYECKSQKKRNDKKYTHRRHLKCGREHLRHGSQRSPTVNVVHGNTLGTKQCFSRGEAVEGRIFFRLGVTNGVLFSARQLLHWVTELLHAVSLDETCVSMKICKQGCDLLDSGVFLIII